MSLKKSLITRIRSEGPMRLDDYMATCLLHPTMGYYTTRDPLGTEGDFTTAPEISQMFGELIGLSLAQAWLAQGAPAPFSLVELGPGRGTLMADLLRACRRVPGFLDAAEIYLVEASPALRQKQIESLQGHRVTHIASIAELPEQPLFLVANEFLDALPIRQFVREGDLWRERQVGVSGDGLTFGLAPAQPQPTLQDRLEEVGEGGLVEVSASLAPLIAEISDRVADQGGTALFIDYGDWRFTGSSFQAVQDHLKVDPLENPGQADLTAHVDFSAIAEAAGRCAASQMTPQGVYLERLGITDRARALAARLSGSALESHVAAHRRLTHPDEMGNLFKVIALYPKCGHPPPGLEP